MQTFESNPFDLQSHLDDLYAAGPRKYAFSSTSLQEYFIWQLAFREELLALLGLQGCVTAQVNCQELATQDRGSYIEQKMGLEGDEGVLIPFYLLIPKKAPPFKPILAFHGHDPSAQYCMGQYPDRKTESANLAVENNYAQVLADAGYLVGVVEQRGLGERLTRQVARESGRSCRHLAFAYLLQGRSLLGERIRDGMCAINYLLSRPDITGVLGCTGHSGGGATALWLAALDERIHTAVVSGYFNSFKSSILAMEHCECNYVPGILTLAEMGDLAALMAPRPLCVLHGQQDPIFPVQGSVGQFEVVRQAYALHGAGTACRLAIHAGGHAYHKQSALEWFAKNLEAV